MEVIQYTEPYRHWIVRSVVPCDIINNAATRIPGLSNPGWIRYENPLELHKWTMEDRYHLPSAWIVLFSMLEKQSFITELSHMTSIPVLQADPSHRGAGLHAMMPGGRLGTHIDYALHPSGLERRVNVILALNNSAERHGGATTLSDAKGNVVKKVFLQRNEALVWACGDATYHGVEELSADSPVRYTAASYYLGNPRPGCVREKALFFPLRN